MNIARGRRTLGLLLACSAFAFVSSASADATTFKVTKFKDTNDGACNADCSLREAVVAANAHTGADTIDVPAGTYKLTRAGAGEDISATGDLDVRDGVTINGAGAAGTIVDAGSLGDRVFDVHVTGTAHVTISGMTIRGGHVPDATIPGFFTADGGGVRAGGNVTLKKVVLANNTAGHPMTGSGEGGGVAEVGGRPFVVHVEDSTLTGNTAERGGGASEDGGGKLELVRSTLSGNHAQGDPFSAGGGVIEDGGGSRTDTPAAGITIENSTITGNTAKGASAYGGGIAEDGGGTVDLLNATIAGNHLTTTSSSAAPTAGNVGQDGGGDVAFKDTIVSGGDPANCQSPAGTLTSQGHNLEDAHTCNFTDLTDKTGNPLLGPLADNGGPTKSRAPGKGSPAIDAGAGCLPTDQRGVARPQPPGGSCDIGAVEVNLPPSITIITPANGAHYKQGHKVLANYSCSDPEGAADITLCQGPAPNGKPIDTSTAGKHAFTVQAADKAGNTVKKTVRYTVDTTESSPPTIKGFPPDRGCVPSKLRLKVSVHPRRLKLAAVFLDGKQIASSKNPDFKVTISGSQLSPGRHQVKILREYKSGTKRRSTVSFTRCKKGGRSPHIHTEGTPDQGSCTAKPFSMFVSITRVDVKTIRAKLDGKKFAKPNKAKFTLLIDVRKLKAGHHKLIIRATDKFKNGSVSITDFVRCA